MSADQTPADRLKLAMARMRVKSGAELARRSGQNDVTVRAHLNGTRSISRKSAEAYASTLNLLPSRLLFGVGAPPEGLMAQASAPDHRGQDDDGDQPELPPNLRLSGVRAPDILALGRDVPVLGTAECGENGAFTLQSGDPIDFVRRPPGIANRKGIYCIYTEGSSMEPVYESGDLVFADPHRPPRMGRDVVVQLRAKAPGAEPRCLLKRLVRRTPTRWVLCQFNPALEISLPEKDVIAVHLVLKNHELLGI